MLHLTSRSLATTLTVFIILTELTLFSSCSSQSAHPVSNSQADLERGHTHIVVHGETLRSIAARYNLDYKDLAQINRVAPPYLIYPGQRLVLKSIPTKKVGSTQHNATAKNLGGSGVRSGNGTRKTNLTSQNTVATSTVKWQWPVSGKVIAIFQGETGLNKGIDLDGDLGEPVLAAASGQVLYAGSGLSGYGKLLIIKHNEIFLSAYAHNSDLLVKEGDFVKVGQKIADMGSSGTDRVKLHFEIRSEGNPVDPLKFLPKR